MRFMAIHLPARVFPSLDGSTISSFGGFFRSNLDAFVRSAPERGRREKEGSFFLLLNRDKMMADH